MHAYLTRLGVDEEVQRFFAPYYRSDNGGNLIFDYKGETETFGFAFHRIPVTNHLWLAGNENPRIAGQVFICSSAMEAIAFLALRKMAFPDISRLLFIAVGAAISDRQLEWLISSVAEKKYTLLFANDFLGKVADLKIAAGIRRIPVSVWEQEDLTAINFRYQNYTIDTISFSLNTVEKLTGHRFGVRTIKPKGYLTFFEQLKSGAF
jgi:hypothetical protein